LERGHDPIQQGQSPLTNERLLWSHLVEWLMTQPVLGLELVDRDEEGALRWFIRLYWQDSVLGQKAWSEKAWSETDELNGGDVDLQAWSTRKAGRAGEVGKLAEDVEPALQGGVIDCIGDAEVGVATAENVAGDDQKVAADSLGDEVGGRAPGSAGEGVEGAFGEWKLITIAERGDNHVALAAVGLDVRGQVFVKRRPAGVLRDAGRADEAELLKLGHLLDDPRGAVGEPQTPAGHAVGLAEAIDHQDVLVPGRRRRERSVVTEGPVNLVADQEDVALLAKLGERPHLVVACNSSRRVDRRVDHDALGPRSDGGRDHLGLDPEVGISIDQDGCPAGQRRLMTIHHEAGVEDDDLVAGVDDRADGQQQGARRARGDDHLTIGMMEFGVHRGLKRAAQLGDAL